MDRLEMKQKLEQALQDLRECRNNMSKEEFLDIVYFATADPNVAIVLMEAASVCTLQRLQKNAEGQNDELP